MKKLLTYAASVALTEGAGLVVGLLTRQGTQLYAETIAKPPFSPPGIVFPIAWTILYGLMGVGLARILMTPASPQKTRAIVLFAVQLVLNLAWSFVFFGARAYGAALVELLCLLAAVVLMTLSFARVDGPSAKMQIPYLAWLCFATYLNAGVVALNG